MFPDLDRKPERFRHSLLPAALVLSLLALSMTMLFINISHSNTALWTVMFAFLVLAGQLVQMVASRKRQLTEPWESQRHAELTKNEILQRIIVNDGAYAIIATDPAGLITTFNPAAERLLGYQASEVLHKTTPGIFHVTEELIDRSTQFSTELGIPVEPGFKVFVIRSELGLPNEYEWTYVRRDGSQLRVLLAVTAMRDSEQRIIGYLGMAADLSDRLAVARDLETKNRFLDTLADNIPGMVGYWSHDLRCKFSNRAYLDWFGKTGQQMANITLPDLLGPVLYEKNYQHIRAALAGESQHFERTIVKPDGSEGHTWSHYIPDTDGNVVRGIIVLVTDVTELKVAQLKLEKANQELKEHSNDLEMTGQIAGIGAWSIDLENWQINWSAQTARLHEVAPGYVPHMDEAIKFYAPSARPVIQELLAHSIESLAPWDIELPMITAKGNTIWARIVGQVEADQSGKAVRLLGAFQDITEKRKASEALTAARDQLLLAARVAGLGIWAWNLEDDTLTWNDWMYQQHDLPVSLGEKELTLQHWQSRIHPDDLDRVMATLHAALDGRGTFDPIYRIVRGNQEIQYIQADAFIERTATGTAHKVTGINLNITEGYLMETSLREAKEQSDLANRAKSEFLANMSHEIRTPMNAILGMLQLLQNTELNHRQRDYTSKTESSARALLGILNDILDFSRVEAGKLILDPHPFDIDKLLSDVAVIMSVNVGDKNIELIFDVDQNVPHWVIGDAMRLQQILINLAGNAIKFTASGEIILSVKRAYEQDDSLALQFSVTDTGIGISPAQCDHIFSGFSQAEASTSRRYGGSGLGLAISQRFVQLMQGQINVHSELGKGSTFSFTAVFQNAQNAQNAQITQNVQNAPPLAALTEQSVSRRCLIVDDNASTRAALHKMLGALGWQADTAETGKLAVRLAQRQPYDLVLADWLISDGLRYCELLSKALPDSAVLLGLVTAPGLEKITQYQHQQAQHSDLMDGFLVKPVTKSVLLKTLAELPEHQNSDVDASVTTPQSALLLADIQILVVEDNLFNQQVIRELLSQEGASVVVVDGGQAGIDIVNASEQEAFDVILMDIQMPDMDGYTATRKIREQSRHAALPIIAITANAMQSDRDEALAAGMNDHVGKPFQLDELIRVILHHCRKIKNGVGNELAQD